MTKKTKPVPGFRVSDDQWRFTLQHAGGGKYEVLEGAEVIAACDTREEAIKARRQAAWEYVSRGMEWTKEGSGLAAVYTREDGVTIHVLTPREATRMTSGVSFVGYRRFFAVCAADGSWLYDRPCLLGSGSLFGAMCELRRQEVEVPLARKLRRQEQEKREEAERVANLPESRLAECRKRIAELESRLAAEQALAEALQAEIGGAA